MPAVSAATAVTLASIDGGRLDARAEAAEDDDEEGDDDDDDMGVDKDDETGAENAIPLLFPNTVPFPLPLPALAVRLAASTSARLCANADCPFDGADDDDVEADDADAAL